MAKEYNRTAIGNRLHSGIVDSGMSIEAWATANGFKPDTVKAWCAGRSGITLENAYRLCDALGWSLDRLAVREG